MTKRAAEYDLENQEDAEDFIKDVGKIDTPEQIQQRKIIQVKGPKNVRNAKPTNLVITAKLPVINLPPSDPKTPEKIPSLEQTPVFNISQILQEKDLSTILRPIIETPKKDEQTVPELKSSTSLFDDFQKSKKKLFVAQPNLLFPTNLSIPSQSSLAGTQSPRNIDS